MEKLNIDSSNLLYEMQVQPGNLKNAKATIFELSSETSKVLVEKQGYLVDIIGFLEENGVDRYELSEAVSRIVNNNAQKAIFNSHGCLTELLGGLNGPKHSPANNNHF